MWQARPVCVTGMGAVTPLGCGVEVSWNRLIGNASAAAQIDNPDIQALRCTIGCPVPSDPEDSRYLEFLQDGPGAPTGIFDPDDWVSSKMQGRADRFVIYSLAAAHQAVRQAGVDQFPVSAREGVGTLVGSGIGGIHGISEQIFKNGRENRYRLSPFFVPGHLINLAASSIAIEYGLMGPSLAVATACSSGLHAIGEAARLIACGEADVMVAGGAEAGICPVGYAAFIACRAMSTRNNDVPKKASRPFDRDRSGFVMGEGAGIVVLESREHALNRGASILADIVGYGLSADAFHLTAPREDGWGAQLCMERALRSSTVLAEDIDYINAHATSTHLGDKVELEAVERLFGRRSDPLSMSSTKSSTGHMLGASGAVEFIFCVQALRDQLVPATLNLESPLKETTIDLVPKTSRARQVRLALSNSFAFGGANASVLIRHPDRS